VTLRFLIDEDIAPQVAAGLRRLGADAQSLHDLELNNLGTPDSAVLDLAAKAGRALVTYNRSDFQRLDAQWRDAGRLHAGILWCAEEIIPRRDIGGLVRALAACAARYETLDGLCLPIQRP
jgi:predicted nuclease of predicted toxin-antitoxin system